MLTETWKASAVLGHRHRRGVDRRCATSTSSSGTSRTASATRSATACSTREFIELARAVYVTNDERAAIKKRINTRLGSALVEEKSYAEYRKSP